MAHFQRILIVIGSSLAVLFLAAYMAPAISAPAITTPTAQSSDELESPDVTSINEEIVLPANDEPVPVITEKTDIEETTPPSGAGLPVLLEIPSIGVSAYVEHLGLTPEGNMDMTNSTKNVAWYDLGPQPGQTGSAVIGGHYGYPGPAVFRDLPELKPGDYIFVTSDKGVKNKFIVKETRMYSATDIASEIFFSDDGLSHLNIITCNGTWISSLQTYDKRFVVFTDAIS